MIQDDLQIKRRAPIEVRRLDVQTPDMPHGAIALPSAHTAFPSAVLILHQSPCQPPRLHRPTDLHELTRFIPDCAVVRFLPLMEVLIPNAPYAQKSVAKESNQSVSPPQEHVSFYWIFFNRSHTPPLDIDIPRQLFNGKSQECLQLFVDALRKYYGLNFQPGRVEFWVPRECLAYNKAPRNGWPTTISDFETAFQKVRRRTSLATALAGQQLEDDDAVHLIDTV
ncbi:hypothetical protein BDQ12DRAFT_728278 [Crucibulum laeve]|uniref:Uncharacterized protein n=1 Tax=Crucibulum laeve TaxID=68775 RepID=A0A5C3LKR6_9AGAR|nr:hypothetical protein BDQ12DRAFT_728278 [Crucibulum laeve]